MHMRYGLVAGIAALALMAGSSAQAKDLAAAAPTGGTEASHVLIQKHAAIRVRGIDHVGITVPDMQQAVGFFHKVLGCNVAFHFGPFSGKGDFMHKLLNVSPHAVIENLTMMRCGNGSNLELFQYSAPNQNTSMPRDSDYGGYSIAFYVYDIDATVAKAKALGLRMRTGPFTVQSGPSAGETISYVLSPWGLQLELLSYPHGMAYAKTSKVHLWAPKEKPDTPGAIRIRGIDHIGITVPDTKQAVGFFHTVLGCEVAYQLGPLQGKFLHKLQNINPRTVVEHVTMMRCGKGSNLALFQYRAPSQDTLMPLNSDFAGHHIAFYAFDEKAAVAKAKKFGLNAFMGPFPVKGGPAAGQTINYVLSPWGQQLELITYPNGMAYEKASRVHLWPMRQAH